MVRESTPSSGEYEVDAAATAARARADPRRAARLAGGGRGGGRAPLPRRRARRARPRAPLRRDRRLGHRRAASRTPPSSSGRCCAGGRRALGTGRSRRVLTRGPQELMMDVCEVSAGELRAALARREVSAAEVLEAVLDRADRLLRSRSIRSHVRLDERARAAAAERRRRARARDRWPAVRAARDDQGLPLPGRSERGVGVTGARGLRPGPRLRRRSSGSRPRAR